MAEADAGARAWTPAGGRQGRDLADRLLRALEGDPPRPTSEPWPVAGRALELELQQLVQMAQGLSPQGLSDAACDLSQHLYQLRAWYCLGLGFLVLSLLDRVAGLHTRLPPPYSRADASLSVLRLMEGLLLMCTVCHARDKVVKSLEQLLRKRKLPQGAGVRLEATLVCLAAERSWPGVPRPVPLDEQGCEDYLISLAKSLEPDGEALERVRRAKETLELAAEHVFPGCRVDYFGSSVNGFETTLSDVDCVVQLAASDVEKLLDIASEASPPNASSSRADAERGRRKASATVAARVLGDALEKAEDLQKLGLVLKEVITEARVPLVKCESAEGVAIDVSFNNTLPLHNSRLLRAYADLDTLVPQLGRLVKMWAKRRHVNDVMEGTLSSYSHIILVIHYLQHIGLLPNLQDKQLVPADRRGDYGRVELLDGRHDVWFLDPERLSKSLQPELKDWLENAPDDARLQGLLAGFFHYFAYEFPMHSEVVSTRHGRDVSVLKLEHFRALAAARSVADADAEAEAEPEPEVEVEAVPEADAEAAPDGAEEAEDEAEEEVLMTSPCIYEEEGHAAPDDPAESHRAAAPEAALEPEAAAAEDEEGHAAPVDPAESHRAAAPETELEPEAVAAEDEEAAAASVEPSEGPAAPAPAAAPAAAAQAAGAGEENKKQLPPAEHWAQLQLSGRQVLCIDDPMELGRTLGASFQGMERLSFEFRRACALLGDGAREDQVKKLFSDTPPPARSIWKLLEQFRLPSVLAGRPSTSIPSESQKTIVVPVPRGQGGRLMGKGGGRIRELQAMPGVRSVHMLEPPGQVGPAELKIVGSEQAALACEAKAREFLGEAPREARAGSGYKSTYYPGGGGRGSGAARPGLRWANPGAPVGARPKAAPEEPAASSSKGRGRGAAARQTPAGSADGPGPVGRGLWQ